MEDGYDGRESSTRGDLHTGLAERGADRPGPELLPVVVDEGVDDLYRRSHSARGADNALALRRISLARRSSRTSNAGSLIRAASSVVVPGRVPWFGPGPVSPRYAEPRDGHPAHRRTCAPRPWPAPDPPAPPRPSSWPARAAHRGTSVKSLVVVWGPFVVRGQWVSVGGVSGWSSWSLLVVWHCLRVSRLR